MVTKLFTDVCHTIRHNHAKFGSILTFTVGSKSKANPKTLDLRLLSCYGNWIGIGPGCFQELDIALKLSTDVCHTILHDHAKFGSILTFTVGSKSKANPKTLDLRLLSCYRNWIGIESGRF